jgi:hypothetical protein
MSTLAVVAVPLIAVTVLAPHVLPLHRAAPTLAIVVWVLALALRALSAVALATLALVGLADVPVVQTALNWCWHALLPDLPAALGFAEHPVSHAAVAVPALVLVASLAWLGARALRAAVSLRRVLRRALGTGPLGSTVIRDDRVLMAVAGFGPGRVLVSDRTLGELDQEELVAGLMHERAHLRRRHRPLLVASALLGAIGRPLPGTGAAERELRFHLERDADQYAVRALNDPLALASAICKTAGAAPTGAVAGLGGRSLVSLRLEELLDGGERLSAPAQRGVCSLAALLAVLLIGLAVSAPAWGLGEVGQAGAAGEHDCEHTR